MIGSNKSNCAGTQPANTQPVNTKPSNNITKDFLAKDLLQRELPADYRAAQTLKVAEVPQRRDQISLITALIFRLGREWLALPAALCQQILSPVSSHWIPHRSNQTLLGITNVRGQLLLKVSLSEILGLSSSSTEASAATEALQQAFRGYRRMVVVEKTLEDGTVDVWAFEADELYGIHALAFEDLQPVTAGIGASGSACTRYIFTWNNQQVNFLDDIKLFERLRRSAL